MMTPKEVQEHGFPRSRKGYDMAEVDEFLDKLTEDYTALYNNYGKLSSSYAKLRKKAQALAAALEQVQKAQSKAAPAPVQKAEPAPAPKAVPATAVVASQDAVDELLRAARKDAQAIRAGAERERQEIINQATNYAAENVDRLKAEVAAEEQHLASLKKATATYVSQVRQLISRQSALLDSSPVVEEGYVAEVAPVEEAPAPVEVIAEPEEPTVRVDEAESSVAEEISRNMLNLQFGDENESSSVSDFSAELSGAFSDLEDAGSLFDAITGGNGGEFDEE